MATLASVKPAAARVARLGVRAGGGGGALQSVVDGARGGIPGQRHLAAIRGRVQPGGCGGRSGAGGIESGQAQGAVVVGGDGQAGEGGAGHANIRAAGGGQVTPSVE